MQAWWSVLQFWCILVVSPLKFGLKIVCTLEWLQLWMLTQWLNYMVQVTKYTVREVLNHKRLVHPHIVEMREVRNSVLYFPHSLFFTVCSSNFETIQSGLSHRVSMASWSQLNMQWQSALQFLLCSGFSDRGLSWDRDGVCCWRRYVSISCQQQRSTRNKRPMVLSATHCRCRLLPQNGKVLSHSLELKQSYPGPTWLD